MRNATSSDSHGSLPVPKRVGAVVVTENGSDFSLIRKHVSFAFVAM
jgi:hypothetical protein